MSSCDISLNPFLMKQFYILESKPDTVTNGILIAGGKKSCLTTTTKSAIYYSSTTAESKPSGQALPPQNNISKLMNGTTNYIFINYKDITAPLTGNTNLKNPVNILDIQNYIADKLKIFLQDSAIAQQCDTDSRYLKSTTTKNTKNDITCCGNPNESQVLYNPSCTRFTKFYTDYQPTTDYSSFPRLTIADYVYKSGYQDKSLCQQMNDIMGLTNDLNTIVGNSSFNTNLIQKYNTNCKKEKGEFDANYNAMVTMRQKTDTILQDLLHINNNDLKQNTLQLDSTIYTTVLWTVLATSILYYVFIKI